MHAAQALPGLWRACQCQKREQCFHTMLPVQAGWARGKGQLWTGERHRQRSGHHFHLKVKSS